MDVDGISGQVVATLVAAAILGAIGLLWRFPPLRRMRLRSPFYLQSPRLPPSDHPPVAPQVVRTRPPTEPVWDLSSPEALGRQLATYRQAIEATWPEQGTHTRDEAPLRRAIKQRLRQYRDLLRNDTSMWDSDELETTYQEIADYIEDTLGREERIQFWSDTNAIEGMEPETIRLVRIIELLNRIDEVPLRPDASP